MHNSLTDLPASFYHRFNIDMNSGNTNDENSYHSIRISKATSNLIAPPLTKSVKQYPHMLEWRRSLTCNSTLDVMDMLYDEFYSCTVIECDEKCNLIKVTYDGFADMCDEWITRDDTRIQPPLKMCANNNGQEMSAYNLLSSTEDPMGENIYAVDRGLLSNLPFVLVDLWNDFGNGNGFEILFSKLESFIKSKGNNQLPQISVNDLRLILEPMADCCKLFTARLADKYIQKLCELLFEYTKNLSEQQMKAYTTEIYTQWVLMPAGLLMERYSKLFDFRLKSDENQLNLGFRFLQSNRITPKADGLFIICRIIEFSLLTPEKLKQWMNETNILPFIFVENATSEMIEKSSVIIRKYIEFNGALNESQMDCLWYLIRKDSIHETLVAGYIRQQCRNETHSYTYLSTAILPLTIIHIVDKFYFVKKRSRKGNLARNLMKAFSKLMSNQTNCFRARNVEYIFHKMLSIPHKELHSYHMGFFQSLGKIYDIEKYCNIEGYAWNIINDEKKRKSLRVRAIYILMAMLSVEKNNFVQKRLEIINKCLMRVKGQPWDYISLFVICRVVKLYPIISSKQEPQRFTIVEYLINVCRILDVFFDGLKVTNIYQKYEMKNNKKISWEYIDEIKQRLLFLDCLFDVRTHVLWKLDQKQTEILWDFCVSQSESKSSIVARGISLKWFNVRKMVFFEKSVVPWIEQQISGYDLSSLINNVRACKKSRVRKKNRRRKKK